MTDLNSVVVSTRDQDLPVYVYPRPKPTGISHSCDPNLLIRETQGCGKLRSRDPNLLLFT